MASLTLAQAALLSQDELVQGVVKEIITVDLFASRLPFVPANGKALVYNRELTESGVTWLDVNAAVNATQATVTQVSQPLGRIVGDVEVDDFEQIAMSNINDHMAVQLELKAKAIGRQWKDKLISGTGVFPQFSGISVLCDSSQVVAATTATAGANLTFELLDRLLDTVTAKDGEVDWIIMDSEIRRQFKSLVRAQGFSNDEVEIGFLDPITGEHGTNRVLAYDGIPIFRNDYVATETVYNLGGKHRLYAGVVGEKIGLTGVMPSDGDPGIRVSLPFLAESKDATIRRVKMYTGLALYSSKAMAKLENLVI